MRLYDLMFRTKRCIYIGTAMLITLSNVDSNLQSLQVFKETLKQHISVVVESANSDKELEALVPNIADQIIKDINETKKSHTQSPLPNDKIKNMKEQILEMTKADHKIKNLVSKYMFLYFHFGRLWMK